MVRPLAIDLYCGLGGWAEGLIAAGWQVIGFDLEDMRKLLGEPELEHHALVLQDVLTLNGAQFKDAQLIVGSSPCQEFSYRAMPWKRAKALGPPELGMKLFHAQFRIQREASEAAGRPIPMVVENVRGAQPWVGRARWNFGSYYLWGDVPALMPLTLRAVKVGGTHISKVGFNVAAVRKMTHGDPNLSMADGRKLPGFRFDGSGGSFQSAAVKTTGHPNIRDGHSHTRHLTNPAEHLKSPDVVGGWFGDGNAAGHERQHAHKSPARKAASARIAKIPFSLAAWIGKAWLPTEARDAA